MDIVCSHKKYNIMSFIEYHILKINGIIKKTTIHMWIAISDWLTVVIESEDSSL